MTKNLEDIKRDSREKIANILLKCGYTACAGEINASIDQTIDTLLDACEGAVVNSTLPRDEAFSTFRTGRRGKE